MRESALYVEIYEKLLNDIRSGEYGENKPLPAERYLCEKYFVSRSTIRQAIRMLQEAGEVYTIQGNGTFVKPRVFMQPLKHFYSFTDTLKNSDILIQNRIIDYEKIPACAKLAQKTNYAAGSLFHKLIRLRSASEYPLMLETTYLPCARFVKLDLDILAKGSLYEFLRTNYNFRANHARETLCPVMPLPKERELLQIPANTPCILLERFSYEDTLLVEYTKSVIRGDKYIFDVDLQAL